ncbi:hypothetical protein V8V88_13000 [Paenibacillus phytohabitans]
MLQELKCIYGYRRVKIWLKRTHDIHMNHKCVTDITYLIFGRQRLYLFAIKNLFNNEIVAYKISPRNDLKLVLDTVKKARKRRAIQGVLFSCTATKGSSTPAANTAASLSDTV